jgi:tryptophan synthase alpha subunit
MRNQELTEYSRCFSKAREEAVADVRRQADGVGAAGVVGVRLVHRISREKVKVAQTYTTRPSGMGFGVSTQGSGRDERAGLIITIHAVGTAIRRAPAGGRTRTEAILRMGATA